MLTQRDRAAQAAPLHYLHMTVNINRAVREENIFIASHVIATRSMAEKVLALAPGECLVGDTRSNAIGPRRQLPSIIST